MVNPIPRAQITSMFVKGTKNEIIVDGYNRNSAKFTDLTRSLFHQQTHAKLADNVAENGFFHNVIWKLNGMMSYQHLCLCIFDSLAHLYNQTCNLQCKIEF